MTPLAIRLLQKLEARQPKLSGYWVCSEFVHPVLIKSDNGDELLVEFPTGNTLPCKREWFLGKFSKK
jgi:hypothetical protein